MAAPIKPHAAGFTLVELLVSLAILIACLVYLITSLHTARIRHNEESAQAALRNILSTESAWRQNDMDGNALPDYWTADVWGFYACADSDGRPLKLIPLDMARSDRDPAGSVAGYTAPRPFFAQKPPSNPVACNGYLLEAMVKADDGVMYAQDNFVTDGKALENVCRFGFAAFPEAYGGTGRNRYIVNEEGVIYDSDNGPAPPINTTNWPAPDTSPSSKPPWHIPR